jgi:TPP-dependent pyruvate/acetoin dehydrogenase alpha subunit
MVSPGLLDLYREMARARAFEQLLADLWWRGLISGELHLGTGEEAVAAGVVSHLVEGDALALDHRPTPELVIRGVDLLALLHEMLGNEAGLGRGRGGHMHLLSKEHLCASSGIVGAGAPFGAGFALAAKLLRPGAVAVAFVGEGAMNQGMVLETMNLAAAWSLPLVLVCKDDNWAITTRSEDVTGGGLRERAAAFGLASEAVDGLDVEQVFDVSGGAIERARQGGGPSFIHARCVHLDGHFLGDPLLRIARKPFREGRGVLASTARASLHPRGGSVRTRAESIVSLLGMLSAARSKKRRDARDPLELARRALDERGQEFASVERDIAAEMAAIVGAALDGIEEGPGPA